MTKQVQVGTETDLAGIPVPIYETVDTAVRADLIPAPARILTVQEIITLLTGNASCALRAALIKAGHPPNSTLFDPAVGDKYQSLNLYTEERILRFWKYLGDHMSVFAFIEESKADCYPNVCPADDVLLNRLVDQMNTICELLKTPERLLPLDEDGLEKIALEMANQVLSDHPSTKDEGCKMDNNNHGAILGKDVPKMRDLTERCRQTERVYIAGMFMPPLGVPGMKIGGEYPYYNQFDGDVDDYGDDVGSGPFKTNPFMSPPCAGEMSPRARAVAKVTGAEKPADAAGDNPCCKHAYLKPTTGASISSYPAEDPNFGPKYPWEKGTGNIAMSYEPGKSLAKIQNNLIFKGGGLSQLDGELNKTRGHINSMIADVTNLPLHVKCYVCRKGRGSGTAYKGAFSFWHMMDRFIYLAHWHAGIDDETYDTPEKAAAARVPEDQKKLADALDCEKAFGYPVNKDVGYSIGYSNKEWPAEGSPAWRMYKGQCEKK